LSAAQADLERFKKDKQSLQQRLQTNHDELEKSLHELEGLRLDIEQREAAHREKSAHADKLQAQVQASQQNVETLQAQLESQADNITGMTLSPIVPCYCDFALSRNVFYRVQAEKSFEHF